MSRPGARVHLSSNLAERRVIGKQLYDDPTLRSHFRARLSQLEDVIAPAIVEDLGATEDDPRTQLVANSLTGAFTLLRLVLLSVLPRGRSPGGRALHSATKTSPRALVRRGSPRSARPTSETSGLEPAHLIRLGRLESARTEGTGG